MGFMRNGHAAGQCSHDRLAIDTGAKSVVMTDRIIGCPHEEGIDYEGSTCPDCPFWVGRDRWTGKRLQ